ncbi:MAG: VOC family protein [Gemmatimonadales bacterium]
MATKTKRRTATKRPASAPRRPKRRQPETLRLRSVNPSFTVDDLQRSINWYSHALGFVVTDRWEENGRLVGVMLKAGSCQLGLSQDDFAKGRDRPKGVGFRVWCSTAQDIDALAERVRAYGGGGTILEQPADRYGSRSFLVQDPDGFRLSLSRG